MEEIQIMEERYSHTSNLYLDFILSSTVKPGNLNLKVMRMEH